MCGRYRLVVTWEEFVGTYGLFPPQQPLPGFRPRYNVAPTDPMPIVVGPRGDRVARAMRWGLLPPWAKALSEGAKMINARAETPAEKATFRSPLRQRRCLVPADGWYEWEKPSRQAWLMRRQDRGPFAFAGMWERRRPPDGGPAMGTLTIITCEANVVARHAHHRMPVVLPQAAWAAWTDPKADVELLQRMLVPAAEDVVVARKVGPLVGNVRNGVAEASEEIG